MQYLVTFSRDIRPKFGIPNPPQSSDISNFWISGRSLIIENSHNSGTSNDIDMKLRPVTKLDSRNKTMSKNIDSGVMSANCDVTDIFLIYGQFGAIWKPDSGRIVCKTYIFINSNLLSYKN